MVIENALTSIQITNNIPPNFPVNTNQLHLYPEILMPLINVAKKL